MKNTTKQTLTLSSQAIKRTRGGLKVKTGIKAGGKWIS
jgi:hypothetical protein